MDGTVIQNPKEMLKELGPSSLILNFPLAIIEKTLFIPQKRLDSLRPYSITIAGLTIPTFLIQLASNFRLNFSLTKFASELRKR